MREDTLKLLLSDLNGRSTDIEGSALVSKDGLIIASYLSPGMAPDRVSTLVAALHALGDLVSTTLHRGAAEHILISGKQGYVLINQTGDDAILCLIGNKSVDLGLLSLEASRAPSPATASLQ